jgi:hypothetical protein
MRDDIAMTTGNSQDCDSPDIIDLGNDVYQIDTRMAGYQGITAGYLIRSSRPCLVETGTSRSAPVVRAALAALEIGACDLATGWLGPDGFGWAARRDRLPRWLLRRVVAGFRLLFDLAAGLVLVVFQAD